MSPFGKRNKQNGQAERHESRTGGQPTLGAQDAPASIGWSSSAGSTHSTDPGYPMPSGLAQQGSSVQQRQQGGFGTPQQSFPGGFFPLDTDIHSGTTTISTSPTSLTGPSDSISHPPSSRFSPQAPPPVAPPNVDWDECYAWFLSVDQDGNGQVSREELRSGLVNDGGMSFSSRTVDHLMDTFDQDGNDTISFGEFKHLWKYIAPWRQMFDSFDVDQNGKIDANELSRALAHYDLQVGQPILDMLMKKYGIKPPPNRYPGYSPRIQMNLDHFMCACIVVRQMCELYEKSTGGQGQSRMNRDEFLKAVISLP